ncbi:MAG: hypothetical protein HKN56_01720 [Gammaproteobacteria bacterium]|nr:hypothetical protein [Gammaproteobacteria bacterium]NND53669.1 hypothetical protein [Gammaproteobacteria bacterium]
MSSAPTASLTYRLTLIGLVCLCFILPWWLWQDAGGFNLMWSIPAGMATPVLLLIAVINRTRNWSGITALCMIPLTVIGVMDVVANFSEPLTGLSIALVSIVVFLAALDAGRRS